MIIFNRFRIMTSIGTAILFFLLFANVTFAQIKIMPLGDSITRGFEGSTDGAGYRNDLADSLNAEGENFVFVGSITTDAGGNHEGHDGKRADFILANINTYLTSENPDIVLLHIGTNDISEPKTSANIRTDIEGIIDAINSYNSSIKIILSSLIPRNDNDGGVLNDNTTILNNLIVGMYLEKRDAGYQIFFAGNSEVFKCNPTWRQDYLADKVHPNDAGYAVMAGVWFNAIMNSIYNASTYVTDGFKRQNLGIVWESDIENKIVSDELINDASIDGWDYLSIYKGITNPSKASMMWSSTSDASGLEASGLALRLDQCDAANANGYAVTVRRSRQELRLWRIEQGAITAGSIDNFDYGLASLPDPQTGQILEVVMSSDGNGNNFEVTINGQAYSTLTDTNPPANSGNSMYAGIILYGNRNNNIAQFSTEGGGDFDPPSQITDLTVPTTTATTATLTWTAPGGDGTTGIAAIYDLRYSTTDILSETDFNAATQANGLPNPSEAGTPEQFIVTDLDPGTTYYFALRSQDASGNNSLISSPVPFATTSAGELVRDNFDGGVLGTEWTADLSYQVVGGELANTSSVVGEWNIAVYKEKSNPITVAFNWGAGADAGGIDQGGIAVMLDSPDTTANGYLITRRTAANEIRLWKIINGENLSKIQVITPIHGPPQAEQEFRVELFSNGGGNHFKVFVNGREDVTLTDPDFYINPTNVVVQYAGIMSSGGKNNNVDNFRMLLSPNQLDKIVETDGQTGTVGKTLPLSIKVKLTNSSLEPVPDENIKFEVTSIEGSLSDASGSLIKEAEDATLTAPMTTASDPAASNGTYIWVPEGQGTGTGAAVINFNVAETADYYMWGRAIAPDAQNDIFKIQMDSGTLYTWDIGQRSGITNWEWDAVSHRGSGSPTNPELDPVVFSLTDGVHTLYINEGKDGAKLDQIVLTTNPNYVPSGMLSTGGREIIVITDGNGEAGVNWILGTVAGSNNNTVKASFGGQSVDFSAIAEADIPFTITKGGEDQPRMPAGTQLPVPLTVLLQDQYLNPVPLYETNWQVITGNGTLATLNPSTDATGSASNTLTTATDSAVTEVRVTAVSYAGEEIIFGINAASGPAANIVKYDQDSGDNQTGTASKLLAKAFKVLVTDNIGIPVTGVDVTFTRIDGGGNFSGNLETIVQTDINGIAQATLTLGPNPDMTNTATASASLSGSPITFTATSAAPQKIEPVSLLTHNGTVNLPLADSIKVKVLDMLNQPLPGFAVNFVVTIGSGKANGASNKEVPTDGNGVAAVEWRLGPTAGQSNNELKAVATFNSTELTGSPITFSASANRDVADRLVYVSGDKQSGTIDTDLSQPFVVKVTDSGNNVISNWDVTFEVIEGGGSINGQSIDTIPTDANGLSSAILVLGSTSATPENLYNNRVKVTAQNAGKTADLNDSPRYFEASAVPTAARNLILSGGTGQTAQAGLPLPQQVKFKVTDNHQNPIKDHFVTFKIKSGGGTINSTSPADTLKAIPTNVFGEAAVTWYLGGALGDNAQILTASADNGIGDLSGSPKDVFATATVGPVDPDVSYLVSDKAQLPVGGQSKAAITVTFADKFGNPISGKAVILKATGSNNIIEQPSETTDENGQAVGFISSTKAETKLISARNILDGFDLNNSIPVIFSSIPAEKIDDNRGNSQIANVGTVLGNPLEVIVKDSFNNPVEGVDVEFVVTNGSGFVINATSAAQGTLGKVLGQSSTNANGIARTTWVLGPNPGENTLEARVNGLLGSPVIFTATGVTATATTMAYHAGDNQAGVTVGRILPSPLEVTVTDANQKPVWNVPVVYMAKTNGGSFAGAYPDTTVYTNHLGIAGTYFTLDTLKRVNVVEAAASLSGSPYTFTFQSKEGLPSILDDYEGNGGSGLVDSNYPISVIITDVYGNPVEDISAAFQVISGGATFEGASSTTTNSSGIAEVQLRLPTTIDTVEVKATSTSLENFYEIFSIAVVSGGATSIAESESSGNNQIGTIERKLVYPFEVIVTDGLGNPVSGMEVKWWVTQGNGSVETDQTWTDQLGLASTYLTLGSQPENNQVWAVAANLNPDKIIFNATGVTNRFPVFDTIGNKTIDENNQLVFQVLATDADSDPITYSIENKPAGANFNTGSATFSWTPDNQQTGDHEVTFKASDNKGGFDAKTITITVNKLNNLPQITAYEPQDLDFVINKDRVETIIFSVTASDIDNDNLDYSWKRDGTLVSISSHYPMQTNPHNPGVHEIAVTVDDGQDSVTMKWILRLITSVDLASFSANFAGYDGIEISWNTSHEIDNSGFNILRSWSKNGKFTRINKEIITHNSDGRYQYFDKDIEVGSRYFYMLEDVNLNGTKTQHGTIFIDVIAPEIFKLGQNYPNPFNPETRIRYQLPSASQVVIKIFDVLGREVMTLVDEYKEAGFHDTTWRATNALGQKVSSGVYYYQISAGEFNVTKKMLLLK